MNIRNRRMKKMKTISYKAQILYIYLAKSAWTAIWDPMFYFILENTYRGTIFNIVKYLIPYPWSQIRYTIYAIPLYMNISRDYDAPFT